MGLGAIDNLNGLLTKTNCDLPINFIIFIVGSDRQPQWFTHFTREDEDETTKTLGAIDNLNGLLTRILLSGDNAI